MLKYSLVLLAVLTTACGAPPEEEQTPPSQQQLAPPPPVTLGDMWSCHYVTSAGDGFSHDIYKYSDGSVFTSCEIADGRSQFINVEMFRGNQAGAATAGCNLTADWDSSATNGWWKFSFNGTTSTATYNDIGSTFNGNVITMTCTKY